ncbi:MAG: arginase family protein [Aureispira sp.]
MIDHLLQSSSLLTPLPSLASFQYSQQLLQHKTGEEQWKKAHIALIGYGSAQAYQAVREALSGLSANFKKGQVIDLGLVRPDLLPLTELLDLLYQQGVFPIVVAENSQAMLAQLRAYEQRAERISLALVDPQLDYNLEEETGFLNQLLRHAPKLLQQMTCIGSQSYLTNPAAAKSLQAQQVNIHRLGSILEQLEEVEPMVRQADISGFSLRTIRAADIPALAPRNPNGLTAAEACRLVRYMSMSDQLSSLCLYDWQPQYSDHGQTALLTAQLIWFAVEGFYARVYEWPVQRKQLRTYVVDSKLLDTAVTFYKSQKSNRWWVAIPEEFQAEQALIACSYADYKMACEGELPDRLLQAIARLR